MLSLTDASFDFGREHILRKVSLTLNPRQKVALVGANGAGKTTLLTALAGELDLQGGVRQQAGTVRIEFLRQETALAVRSGSPERMQDVVADAAFVRERALESELAALAAQLASVGPEDTARLVGEQGRLQDEFERRDGYTMRSRLETALRGVGLMPETWERPVDRLSGGERRRAALAAVLLTRADLLLLDEPTNHLDLDACEWLETFLVGYPGAAVIVSHDRHFLDRVAERTLHLGQGRVVSYTGNYSFYDVQSRQRHEQELAAWQRQQNRIRQTEEYIRRNIEGQKTKQAQSRRKQLEKEVRLERPGAEPGLFRFALRPARASGGMVFEARGLGKGYGERRLLQDFDLHVSRGDRLGIVGPNGCGKSTLLKMLAGRLVPDAGTVAMGHNVDTGFYDQELSGVSDHNTVIAEMQSVDPAATLGELRSFLGAFGFGEDLYDRQVSRLSGGERGRLSLLRLIKEGHNTLLLDEPTNHLDIRSRESLEASLADFDGTLVVVSHDRRFLEKLVDRLIVFPSSAGADTVRQFDGSWAEWERRRREETAPAAPSPEPDRMTPSAEAPSPSAGPWPLSKNEQDRRRRWIAEAEAAILSLEAEKDQVLQDMASPDLDSAGRLERADRCAEIDQQLEKHLGDWEQWNTEIEEGLTGD